MREKNMKDWIVLGPSFDDMVELHSTLHPKLKITLTPGNFSE